MNRVGRLDSNQILEISATWSKKERKHRVSPYGGLFPDLVLCVITSTPVVFDGVLRWFVEETSKTCG
jgi:hypothetical protein